MVIRTLVGTAAVTVPGDEASWVEPDYIATLSAKDLADGPEELRRLLPVPAMLMPAGLLPDGRPPSGDVFVDGERITGGPPQSRSDAESVIAEYGLQQAALRAAAG